LNDLTASRNVVVAGRATEPNRVAVTLNLILSALTRTNKDITVACWQSNTMVYEQFSTSLVWRYQQIGIEITG
jgi:hypothetical protein